jgi:YD repeat-containing protein
MTRLIAALALAPAVFAQPPLEIRSLTPPSGSGYSTTFKLTVEGGGVASVGVYITSQFDGVRPAAACLAYWDRNADAFFLADNSGAAWHRTAARAGAPVENSQCRIVPAESGATVDGERVTVEFAVRFLHGFEGSKLVYAYANAFGDSRNTGWREVGSWRVTDPGPRPSAEALAAAAAGTADPNDLPIAELDRPDTAYQAFLRANAGATAQTHQQGQLRFLTAAGKKAAVSGPVTHRDLTTGTWIPNAPVLSETNNGWRVDGASSALLIKKVGTSQHTILQTFTEYTTGHNSLLVLNVPSLVHDAKSTFHFLKDGLTWKMAIDGTGAFNVAASVPVKTGKKTYTFDLISSEALTIDAKGNLIGDANVKLSRAMMYPKFGKAVACSAWSYTAATGASFTCDDSTFRADQFPYRIDPSSYTYTDTGTYTVTSYYHGWNNDTDSCDCGGYSPDVAFNTSGLIPSGGTLISTSCAFNTGDNVGGPDHLPYCSVGAYNNSGSTHVTVSISGDGCEGNSSCSWDYWADVSNISLTVTWQDPVSVTVLPATASVNANQTQQFTATVQNTSNTAVTWSRTPALGSVSSSGLYTPPSPISSQQNVTVTATSVADPTRSGSATVTLMPVTVSVSSANSSISPSRTNQFTATVTGSTNSAVTWSMVSGPGTINGYGVYVSPISVTSNTTVTVRATSVADTSQSGTASVTVTPWGAGTPYQYYVTDAMTSINANLWQLNGSAAASSGGLTAGSSGGSAVSRLYTGDGSSDYEVQATVHVPNPVAGGTYSVLARASSDGLTAYSFNMVNPGWDSSGCSATFTVKAGSTLLAQLPYTCHDGMKLRMVVRGSAITVGIDTGWSMTLTDTSLTSGTGGFYVQPASGATISSAQIGMIDTVAPSAVDPNSVVTSASPMRVDMRWTASVDDNAGSGMAGYTISRDGVVLGTTATTSFTDETFNTSGSKSYSIVAFDWHGNSASAGVKSVSVPASPADPLRTGVRPTGAYWGAAREQIDMMSGNLNFALPILTAKSRGGWSATFMLSYNSQMWRQDAGGTWLLGKDVGYGLGWRLQAGSIFPVIYNGSVLYLIFSDATGAEYRLYDDGNWIFRSREGLHLWMDWSAGRLYFPDGGWWGFGCVSSGLEPDAGTKYPNQMGDTNGNTINIQYQAGAGSNGINTSARLLVVQAGNGSFGFGYSGGVVPHLTSAPGETTSYAPSYTSVSLSGPFAGGGFGTAQVLSALTINGMGTAHQFAYNSSGEMTQVTTPLGGVIGWNYRSYTYSATGRSFREVQSRTAVIAGATPTTNTWNMTTDSGTSQHATWTVSDTGANSSKVWTIGTSGTAAGAVTSYEERGPGGTALIHKDYSWTTDNISNMYVNSVVTTEMPGANQVQSMSTQTLDTYGNITQSAVYDYGNLTTPAKTYNFSYLHTGNSNYDSRYIRNRVSQVTVTPAGGGAITLVTNNYDDYSSSPTACGGAVGMVLRSGAWLHDDTNFGTGFTYRGNVTSRVSLGGSATTRYESTGVPMCTVDGAGVTATSAPSSDTSYSLPGVLTPGGNSNLATTVTYATSWQVTSVSGPNGAQGTTTYDGLGRPLKTKIPDGAETNYTYAYTGVSGATSNTQTATLGTGTGARFKKTTLDGFGRVTRVETGHDSTTVSQVDTQYAPCACSPLGKLWRVSQPYAPGQNQQWTTYAYDGSGRTVSVTAPDGSVTATQYLTAYSTYTGSMVRMTDAAGKWKIQQTDGMGNLVRVIEPNPAGGADLITNYTYNALGQMTQVSMPRSNGTQTRTFNYSGTDLISATNPENGTVSYQYDAGHRVTQRTDAKGQQTRYVYDAYGRLTQVQHWAGSPLAEIGTQHVDYYYDSNPLNSSYSQNVSGRLAAVSFANEAGAGGSSSYMYSYNQAGRVLNQHATLRGQDFEASYAWDNEGRMTQINYPSGGPSYTMQFDAMGRVGSMTQGGSTFATATYGLSGELMGIHAFATQVWPTLIL